MEREKLLFIYPKLFTFVQTDIELISSDYHVITIDQDWGNKLFLPFNLLYQFFTLLFVIIRVDAILISFGGYWSFLPALLGRIFGKKVSVIVHGTDCVDFPEIKYGSLGNTLMKWFIHKTYQLVNIILPVSESLVFTENNYYTTETLKFGYTYHLKNITTPYKVVPNGLIIENWLAEDVKKNSKTFITVMTESQLKRKGADLIFKVAEKLPDCTFYFAGVDIVNQENFSRNVIFLGRLTPSELKSWYSKTQFYLQLSNFEGFGVAICEAMLCNCIPIVSDVNFLPKIAGNPDFVLKKRNDKLLIQLIKSILKEDLDNLGNIAKQHIINNFSSKRRKKMLIEVLKK